eukprot:m.521542 g.521542  ORF g.521542 m.521542 type:complete len:233 (-) comp21961_c0_seq2:2476-3174(-)
MADCNSGCIIGYTILGVLFILFFSWIWYMLSYNTKRELQDTREVLNLKSTGKKHSIPDYSKPIITTSMPTTKANDTFMNNTVQEASAFDTAIQRPRHGQHSQFSQKPYGFPEARGNDASIFTTTVNGHFYPQDNTDAVIVGAEKFRGNETRPTKRGGTVMIRSGGQGPDYDQGMGDDVASIYANDPNNFVCGENGVLGGCASMRVTLRPLQAPCGSQKGYSLSHSCAVRRFI